MCLHACYDISKFHLYKMSCSYWCYYCIVQSFSMSQLNASTATCDICVHLCIDCYSDYYGCFCHGIYWSSKSEWCDSAITTDSNGYNGFLFLYSNGLTLKCLCYSCLNQRRHVSSVDELFSFRVEPPTYIWMLVFGMVVAFYFQALMWMTFLPIGAQPLGSASLQSFRTYSW